MTLRSSPARGLDRYVGFLALGWLFRVVLFSAYRRFSVNAFNPTTVRFTYFEFMPQWLADPFAFGRRANKTISGGTNTYFSLSSCRALASSSLGGLRMGASFLFGLDRSLPHSESTGRYLHYLVYPAVVLLSFSRFRDRTCFGAVWPFLWLRPSP